MAGRQVHQRVEGQFGEAGGVVRQAMCRIAVRTEGTKAAAGLDYAERQCE